MQEQKVELYRRLHATDHSYGQSWSNHIEYVEVLSLFLGIRSVLDFGCGKNSLVDRLKASSTVDKCAKYDPAISDHAKFPNDNFDMVVSTDVFEHIPINLIPGELLKIKEIANYALIIPHLGLAEAILENGENAHCTVLSTHEWLTCFQSIWPNVIQLSHHSPDHSIYLCSSHELDAARLSRLIDIVRELKDPVKAYQSFLSRPLSSRLHLMPKLFIGYSTLQLLKKLLIKDAGVD